MRWQKIKKHLPFLILIVVNLLFAIFFGSDFGESWDEQPRYDVALEAIERYTRLKPEQSISGKGPIYFVVAKLGGDLIRLIRPQLTYFQAWHYIHFLTFILGVTAFYLISLRFLPPTVAFVTTTLFNTQPVLFGHAFINPKDIPFMSSFLVILASGFSMVDHFPTEKGIKSSLKKNRKPWWRLVKEEWLALNKLQIIHIFFYITVYFASLFLLFFQKGVVQKFLQHTINHIQQPALYRLVDSIAAYTFNGTISGGVTLQNIRRAYPLFVISVGIIITLGIIVHFILYFPRSIRALTGFSSKDQFSSGLATVFKSGLVYPASIILGLSVNNRSLSITAGLFVLFYLWNKNRKLFLPTCVVYLGLATFILYLTWPGLWGNPLTGVIKSLLANSSFSWGGRTLFRGQAYKPAELPLYYLPYLMGIQFTGPAIALALFGLVKAISDLKIKSLDNTLFSIFMVWFLLPFLSALIVKPAIYHNFRHFLFMTPPIFFFSGLGVKGIFDYISQPMIKALIILAIIIPGVLGIIQLHPYQYIYYNQFVGGLRGAFRSYEMDYWLTSYQECVEYINEVADENDVILVYGPLHLVDSGLRSDLKTKRLTLKNFDKSREDQLIQITEYAIIPSRMNHDILFFSDKPTIFSVQRNGAILSVVKELQAKKD